MHRCLAVTDIFRNVLEFVLLVLHHEDEARAHYNEIYTTNPSLAALARTCRTFSDPALDVLWRNQFTLGPLIRTLPSHLVSEEIEDHRHVEPDSGQCVTHHLKLKPLVAPADWDRFDYYAAKIQSLGYFMFEFADQDLINWIHYWMIHFRRPVSRQCMQTLSVYRRRAFILPNLRRLRLTAYDVPILPYVPMLLSTHLQELAIAFYQEQVTGLPPTAQGVRRYRKAFPRLLESLPTLCPSLTDLAIFTEQSTHVTDSVLSFPSRCKDLTGFLIASAEPSRELTLRLAEQTRLRKVHLSFDEETSDISWLQSVRYPFPSLDTLTIRTPTLKSCASLIKLMGDCTLRLVRFDAFDGVPLAADLQELFEAFRDHCPARTLQSIYIEYRLQGRVLLKSEDHALTEEVVSPLYSFSRMRFFRLHIPLLCYLNDQDLMDMADHWPLLIELRLLDGWEWSTGPFNTTWTGVAYLAWKCRQLIELALAWDMRADNAAEITSREGFRRSTSLRFINCLDSVTCDIEVCARNVHAFAPLVWDIWGIGFGEPQPEEDMARLPPAEDPIAFYEALVTVLRASYDSEEVDMSSLASKFDPLEDMNPWGNIPTSKPKPIWTRVQ